MLQSLKNSFKTCQVWMSFKSYIYEPYVLSRLHSGRFRVSDASTYGWVELSRNEFSRKCEAEVPFWCSSAPFFCLELKEFLCIHICLTAGTPDSWYLRLLLFLPHQIMDSRDWQEHKKINLVTSQLHGIQYTWSNRGICLDVWCVYIG